VSDHTKQKTWVRISVWMLEKIMSIIYIVYPFHGGGIDRFCKFYVCRPPGLAPYLAINLWQRHFYKEKQVLNIDVTVWPPHRCLNSVPIFLTDRWL
jgi:hypothetical protein